jgi:hypothetical protein
LPVIHNVIVAGDETTIARTTIYDATADSTEALGDRELSEVHRAAADLATLDDLYKDEEFIEPEPDYDPHLCLVIVCCCLPPVASRIAPTGRSPPRGPCDELSLLRSLC